MKKGIHPEYKKSVIKCACGNTLETMSTKEDIRVEICSACHPLFTGKQKFIDTLGRVDKFEARRKKAETLKAQKANKKSAKKEDLKAEAPTEDEKIEEIEKELKEETVDIVNAATHPSTPETPRDKKDIKEDAKEMEDKEEVEETPASYNNNQ